MKEFQLSDSLLQHLQARVQPLKRRANAMVDSADKSEDTIRAGILPYVQEHTDSGIQYAYYVMKPRPKYLDSKGQPLLQIAKGTRHYETLDATGNAVWMDLKHSDKEAARGKRLEPLLRTALREGLEEILLQPLSMETLFDFGAVAFRSETKATEKSMWLYLAEMKSRRDIAPLPKDNDTTESCTWCTLEEFRRIGRPDHLLILMEVERTLIEQAEKLAQSKRKA